MLRWGPASRFIFCVLAVVRGMFGLHLWRRLRWERDRFYPTLVGSEAALLWSGQKRRVGAARSVLRRRHADYPTKRRRKMTRSREPHGACDRCDGGGRVGQQRHRGLDPSLEHETMRGDSGGPLEQP